MSGTAPRRGKSRKLITALVVSALVLAFAGCTTRPVIANVPIAAPAPRTQNPSPMVETTRRHDRVSAREQTGISFTVDSVLPKPVQVFIPERTRTSVGAPDERTLLVHIFGAAYVPIHAVASGQTGYVLAVINLGAGSSAYEKALSDSAAWHELLRRIREETSTRTNGRVRISRLVVSAFSAGYGGVRALLSDENSAREINGVLLLDGLHTSYIPERTPLAEGGGLDTTKLLPFLRYARRAVAGDARFVITHSEIFPGTFASTTETTDWLIASLGLKRAPTIAWGPGGMQQLSEVRSGGLTILGFAGNTGPDHIDHLHGLGDFLTLLER